MDDLNAMDAMRPVVLCVDGNSLAHRAFHASNPADRDGAWMCDMVVRMISSVWWAGPFDAVIIGFDHDVNVRKQADAGYKAGRAEKDPELEAALAILPDQIRQVGFTVVCEEGMEADDVLASVVTRAEPLQVDVVLLSSDRDLTAQVSESCTLLRPRSTMSDLIVTDPARVRADYGIEPSQYVDFAAMRGDASDGLRGVHGIGPKIAARLLRDHGTIEELYANLHHLLPVHEAKLRAGQAEVDRNLALMTPITSVEVDVMASIAVGLDPGTLDANLVGLGLNRAAGQLRRAMSERQLPPMPPMPQEAPQDIVALPAARTFALVDASEQDALF
ncbi:MAG: 5'-3' exonuclease [Nitriliruptoraceae bacterium]|jgi:5'-3' exonuclease